MLALETDNGDADAMTVTGVGPSGVPVSSAEVHDDRASAVIARIRMVAGDRLGVASGPPEIRDKTAALCESCLVI